MVLPTSDARTGFRSRKPGHPHNRRFTDSGILCRRNALVAFLVLATLSWWPIAHFTGSREFVDDGHNKDNSSAFKGVMGLLYSDDSNDSVDDLPLQDLGKGNKFEPGITKNNVINELQKPLAKLPSEENKDVESLELTNTTNIVRQGNINQIPFIRSRKIQSGNRHTTDAQVQQLKDLLVIAKVYLEVEPTKVHPQFIAELQGRITDLNDIVNGVNVDYELPDDANEKLKAMENTLSKGKQIINDCVTTEKSLRASVHSTDVQLQAEMKQTQFLTQFLAKTLPKALHCLPLRLSIEYYSLNSTQQNRFLDKVKLEDPKLYHYALFSDNVLAAAVVVNSTLHHVKNPADHVFHVVTDGLNYDAMKMWFISNPPANATLQVQKVEEFTWLNSSYSPVLKQLESESMIDYYFRTHGAKSDGNLKYRNPKYLSILNHLRFYLPEIFPKLNKVVFLDDDVVVQKDLTGLWGINLKGNVNGAVETCGKSFHRFDKYLNFSNALIAKKFDPNACGWAYGMNVFDLNEWRKQNITDVYHSWQILNNDRLLWKLGTLPPGLITFYNRTLPLDRSWHVLGLGYDENVKQKDIEHAAVLHYNGNKKPWLDIGMEKYRKYWSKYVDYDQIYLRHCNIVP